MKRKNLLSVILMVAFVGALLLVSRFVLWPWAFRFEAELLGIIATTGIIYMALIRASQCLERRGHGLLYLLVGMFAEIIVPFGVAAAVLSAGGNGYHALEFGSYALFMKMLLSLCESEAFEENDFLSLMRVLIAGFGFALPFFARYESLAGGMYILVLFCAVSALAYYLPRLILRCCRPSNSLISISP